VGSKRRELEPLDLGVLVFLAASVFASLLLMMAVVQAVRGHFSGGTPVSVSKLEKR
jgi:hypothetical protein